MDDLSIIGGVITLGYIVASLLSFRAMRGAHFVAEERLWLVLGTCLLALGVNKQLDLQTHVTQFAREMARAQGWYDHRRSLQEAFVGVLAFSSFCAGMLLLFMLRHCRRRAQVAAAGLIFILAFIVLRVISFHQLESVFQLHLGGLKISWVLELLGILVIILAAAFSAHEAARGTDIQPRRRAARDEKPTVDACAQDWSLSVPDGDCSS